MRAIVLFFMLVSILPSAETTKKKVDGFEFFQIELNIIKKTNNERARHGLEKLTVDHQLMQQARRHAIWMAQHRVLQHGHDIVAENIAMGQTTSTEAVQDWMRSPGHRANILAQKHGKIGVAAYKAADGRIYWCQQFSPAL